MKRLLAVLLLCAAPVMAQRPFVARTYAVGDLPSCTAYTDGWAYVVTDAATSGDCSTGSGSVLSWCICDGGNTTWLGVPTLDSSGQLGIGTSTPGFNLHVYDTGANTTAKVESNTDSAILYLDSNGDGLGAAYSQLVFSDNGTPKWQLWKNTSNDFEIYDQATATTPVQVEAGAGTSTLVVDSNSRVGIGTASPQKILHSYKATGDTAYRIETGDDSSAVIQYKSSVRQWRAGLDGPNSSWVIADQTGNTTMFLIEEGAPTNTLKLQSDGTLFTTPLATAPATCSIGALYFDTSGAFCACTSTNTWENTTGTGACT